MLQFAAMGAERRRGAKLVEDFYGASTVARNGWTSYGTPTYASGGGVILNGSTQYLTRPLAGELYSPNLTIHLEFWPTFATNENVRRYLFSSTAPEYHVVKFENAISNQLRVYLGGTNIVAISEATYSPLWVVGGRNLITITGTTTSTNVDFNGTRIVTADPSVWAPGLPATLYAGTDLTATYKFAGRLGRLLIGHHTSTLAEHTAYWNNSMFSWRNRATVDLQFRTADYDIGNVRTLDSSGNGNHFTLGNGVTATTFPTQGAGRMGFDGGDYLARASVAQPAGAFSVVLTAISTSNGAAEYVAGHGNTGSNFLLANLAGAWSFYVGGTGGGNRSYMPAAHKGVHTYVGTWDGTNTRLIVDGVAMAAAVTPLAPSGGASSMTLGKRVNVASNYMTGTMYDFKYFDGVALNQVQALDYHQQIMRRIGSET